MHCCIPIIVSVWPMPMRHELPHLFSSQIALTFWRWSSFEFYSIHSIEWDACMVLQRTAPSIRSIWSQSTPCAGQTVYSHFVEYECCSTHAIAPLLFNIPIFFYFCRITFVYVFILNLECCLHRRTAVLTTTNSIETTQFFLCAPTEQWAITSAHIGFCCMQNELIME